MNAAHVSRFDTQGNFPLGHGKTRAAGWNFQSSKLQTTRFLFEPDPRRQVSWFNPEAVDLILIGPAWSRDFSVLRCKRASSDASYPRTLVLTSGATRRVGSVRQSSLFHCVRGIPPRYNATTCDHVCRHSLCYHCVTAYAELRQFLCFIV
jgi:hypothetical protein